MADMESLLGGQRWLLAHSIMIPVDERSFLGLRKVNQTEVVAGPQAFPLHRSGSRSVHGKPSRSREQLCLAHVLSASTLKDRRRSVGWCVKSPREPAPAVLCLNSNLRLCCRCLLYRLGHKNLAVRHVECFSSSNRTCPF